jgi:hypothetical protein
VAATTFGAPNVAAAVLNPRTIGAAAAYFNASRRDTDRELPHTHRSSTATQ